MVCWLQHSERSVNKGAVSPDGPGRLETSAGLFFAVFPAEFSRRLSGMLLEKPVKIDGIAKA